MQVQMQPFCAYRFVVLTGAENNRRKKGDVELCR